MSRGTSSPNRELRTRLPGSTREHGPLRRAEPDAWPSYRSVHATESRYEVSCRTRAQQHRRRDGHPFGASFVAPAKLAPRRFRLADDGVALDHAIAHQSGHLRPSSLLGERSQLALQLSLSFGF